MHVRRRLTSAAYALRMRMGKAAMAVASSIWEDSQGHNRSDLRWQCRDRGCAGKKGFEQLQK